MQTDKNPKAARAAADGKVPMDYVPFAPLAAVARVLKGGADKYGRRNWLETPINASTYIGAIARHTLLEWASGVDFDADDGEHPLAHVIACALIVMDAETNGQLVDDRPKEPPVLDEPLPPEVQQVFDDTRAFHSVTAEITERVAKFETVPSHLFREYERLKPKAMFRPIDVDSMPVG